MSQATEVEAHFAPDRRITVVSLAWQGRRHVVTDHGRQWEAADGRHVLVMTAGARVFELLHDRAAGTWALVKAPTGPSTA